MQNISLDPLDVNKARPPALCPPVPPSGADTAGCGQLAWLGPLLLLLSRLVPQSMSPGIPHPAVQGSSSSEPQQLCVPSRAPPTHPRKEPSTDAQASAIRAGASGSPGVGGLLWLSEVRMP